MSTADTVAVTTTPKTTTFASGRRMTLFLMLLLFSYFYNIAVLNYSIKGDNELRLYDLLGPFLFYMYFNHFREFNYRVNKVVFLKWFYLFVKYCSISIFLTLIFSIIKGRIINFVQSFLYLYHMWVFFLGAAFLFFNLDTVKKYRQFLYYVLVLVLLEAIIVILQNLGIVPFLWPQIYYKSYYGFMSGTLGPNKIVLGMFMLMSFGLTIGLYFMPNIRIPKYILLILIGVIAVTLLLTGSRTSYVGAIFFLVYFMLNNTSKFLVFGLLGGGMFLIILFTSPKLVDLIQGVFEERITYVIDGPEDVPQYEDYYDIYSKLSTGRDELHAKYVKYLIETPWVIPVGRGFNNRMGVGNSAHNIYLSFINELGIVGLYIFLRWLFSFMTIKKSRIPGMKLALNGLVVAMLVTLYFGEHLYIYRPLFAILGYFLMVTVLLMVPFKKLQ